ncbi:MAG: hypothetical protein ACR2LT_00565 [Pyrinomonadaceae bacterium]
MKSESEKSLGKPQFATCNGRCSACGTTATRRFAKFCRVCGKFLREDYAPLDALRASYNLQGKQIEFKSPPVEKACVLFERNENPASETAWAFAVYSLVPYLGILFCPGAVLMGGIGIFTSYRHPHRGGRKISLASIILGVIVFAVQILLWWLLYIIPELRK